MVLLLLLLLAVMVRYSIRWELLLLLEMIGKSVVCTVWIICDHRHHSTTTGGHVQYITLQIFCHQSRIRRRQIESIRHLKSFRSKKPRLGLDATCWCRRWYLGVIGGSQGFGTRIQQSGIGNIMCDCSLSATCVGEATTTNSFRRTMRRSCIFFLYSFKR
uniref:Putative secreted protein n=1 Tax=Anopheles darlingi TaxID=43151 RepID=A0A2M4DJN0_ANODA